MKRYTDEVLLAYDSDGAGVKAALRAIPILKEAGLRTRVIHMKPYKDPDEFIKNLGTEAFEAVSYTHLDVYKRQWENRFDTEFRMLWTL